MGTETQAWWRGPHLLWQRRSQRRVNGCAWGESPECRFTKNCHSTIIYRVSSFGRNTLLLQWLDMFSLLHWKLTDCHLRALKVSHSCEHVTSSPQPVTWPPCRPLLPLLKDYNQTTPFCLQNYSSSISNLLRYIVFYPKTNTQKNFKIYFHWDNKA